ncbi:fimbrial biogenesis chaperone [Paraburkholderia dilworthii]|uniref:fimbrial biogenesis chaperone n=1 Tax=Paraburkholderia dilworthii TaxID=948106 RepID=UPI000488183D|nr:fimbria/pilus periplasmic chaperone [Paraburkholderia dilworthii]
MFFTVLGRRMAGVALAALCSVGTAQASILITGTRVIYPMQEREVTVRLTNNGSQPSVVQSWLDNGDPKQTPDTADVPFVLTPPIARVDARRSQSLRIAYTQADLPKDKESLFWLNVLEVPATAKDMPGNTQQLRIVFRSRIKFIMRPQGLEGDSASAAEKLIWRVVPGANGKGWAIECTNPTGFHVSFNRIELAHDGKSSDAGGGMVAPQATERFPLRDDLNAAPADAEIHFSTIDDYGAFVPHKSPLKP